MQRYSRWLITLLVLLALSCSSWAQDGDAGQYVEEHEAVPVEEEPEVEPAVEDVSEGAPAEAEDPEPEVVAEEVVEAVTTSSESIVAKLKSQTTAVVDKCVGSAKSLVDKCKNMSKKDLKKAAVAVVGVWGVSVGVGWLMQDAAPPAPAKGGPFKKK